MIKFTQKGNFNKTERFLTKAARSDYLNNLERFGNEGVAALMDATPVDSGETARSWEYKITRKKGLYSIEFFNSNVVNGIPIAIILQYGHGTNNGGYVQGRDYINPAIQPIFDKLADKAWKEVTTL